MVVRRRMLLALGTAPLWGGFQPVARAEDLYDDYINSASKKPFVAFLGRQGTSSTIGHAFVGVGVSLDATLLVYERFYGLYPKNGSLAAIKSVFSPISGKLDATWEDISWDTELNRPIKASQKVKVLAQFEKWSSAAPQYSLVANGGMNCNSLVSDVAQSLGMKVPDGGGSTRPWKFIEALKWAN